MAAVPFGTRMPEFLRFVPASRISDCSIKLTMAWVPTLAPKTTELFTRSSFITSTVIWRALIGIPALRMSIKRKIIPVGRRLSCRKSKTCFMWS